MQYYEILNLKSEPFSNSPDPEFFYGSRGHGECLRKLEIAIRLRRGLNLVIGEVGTGKTTLCRQLIRELAKDPQVVAHLVLDPSFSTAREFLLVLHRMLAGAEPPENASDYGLKEAVKNALFRLGVEEGRTVALIVDEGQKAGGEFLELLRELLNYETNQAKLLQIVYFAQTEFTGMLEERPNLADRVNLRIDLGPLGQTETKEMIAFRLARASASFKTPELFTPGACRAIHQATGGYPRKVVGLCHRVMLAMLVQNRTRADRAMVRAVLEGGGDRSPNSLRPVLAAGGILVVVALLGWVTFASLDMPSGRIADWAIGLAQQMRSTRPAPDAGPARPAGLQPAPPAQASAVSAPEATAAPAPPAAVAPEATAVLALPARMPGEPARPGTLGSLTVRSGEIVSALISKVYGAYRPIYQRWVQMANPNLAGVDRIDVGAVIIFPAVPMPVPQAVRRALWVRVGGGESLQAAYEELRSLLPLASRLRLLPWWSRQSGMRYDLVAQGPFADQAEAEAVLAALHEDVRSRAGIVRLWAEDAVYFTEVGDWKFIPAAYPGR